MNSRLYKCKVKHERLAPKRHRFEYRLFMFYIDLDELVEIKKLSLISHNRFNYYSFRDTDHIQEGAKETKQNLIRFIIKEGVKQTAAKIFLFTQLRILNYTFNPVSFYFVFDINKNPICAVAEVANTFNEQKLYILKDNDFDGVSFKATRKKNFYISPYSELDIDLSFNLSIPQKKLELHVNDIKDKQLIFTSCVSGTELKLNNANLAYLSLRYPLISFMVIFGIHWQALRLFLKGLPRHKKKDRKDLQTNTRTYLKKTKKS